MIFATLSETRILIFIKANKCPNKCYTKLCYKYVRCGYETVLMYSVSFFLIKSQTLEMTWKHVRYLKGSHTLRMQIFLSLEQFVHSRFADFHFICHRGVHVVYIFVSFVRRRGVYYNIAFISDLCWNMRTICIKLDISSVEN